MELLLAAMVAAAVASGAVKPSSLERVTVDTTVQPKAIAYPLDSRLFLALPGNPYDGHTLAAALGQAERVSGTTVARAYVDRGYRGHGRDDRRVFVSGRRRGITATIRRELKRRSAIEPVIGHMKADGRLDRNFLAGARRCHQPADVRRRVQSAADPQLPGRASARLAVLAL